MLHYGNVSPSSKQTTWFTEQQEPGQSWRPPVEQIDWNILVENRAQQTPNRKYDTGANRRASYGTFQQTETSGAVKVIFQHLRDATR